MGRRTSFSLLVAALLVRLFTHGLPVSSARHVAVLKVDDGLNDRGDMNLAKEPAWGSADDLVAKKGFEGRKLGARDMEEAEAMGVNGDKKGGAYMPSDANHSTVRGSAAAAEPRPRTVEMRAAGKHEDPATEMYDMLRRDYVSRASRRRPINNGQPLQDEEP